MKVRRLFFREMGTYADLYTRPYSTEGDGTIVRDLDEATMGGRHIAPSVISGLATRILRPTADVDRRHGRIEIPNGWSVRRFMFIMEVEVSRGSNSISVEIITGYTEHNEVITRSQNISEDTILRFNGMYTVNTMQVFGRYGAQEQTSIREPIQLVSRRRKPSYGIGGGGDNDTVRMCPEDLFTIKTQVPEFDELAHVEGYTDTRGTIMRPLAASRRENNLSANYLTRALEAARDSHEQDFLGDEDESDRMVRARGKVREPLLQNRRSFARLAEETSIMDSGYMTYGELLAMDPDLDRIVEISFNDDRKSFIDHRNNSENWDERTTEAICATIVAHSIPNLLMECMYAHARIESTNMTFSGRFESVAVKLHPYMEGVDLDENYNHLMSKINTELLPGLILNDSQLVDVTIECAIYGDTVVEISIDGGRKERFVFPTFCDALAAPTVADSRDRLHVLANDIIGIGDQLGQYDDSQDNKPRIIHDVGYKSTRGPRRFSGGSF